MFSEHNCFLLTLRTPKTIKQGGTAMTTSQHAKIRSQQRGIAPLVIDLLLKFGSEEPAGDGASKIFFDKRARRRVKSYAGPLAAVIDDYLDVYAVVGSDNTVITTAHRIDRIRRH